MDATGEGTPYALGFRNRIMAIVACILVVPGGLLYFGRYQLGLANGSYEFLLVQEGTSDEPVAYDRCRPINYVVNDAQAPPEGQLIIDQAIGEVSKATGLRFVYLGTTDLPTGEGRAAGGNVLIDWTDPRTIPELADDVLGVGGSSATIDEDTGLKRYYAGEISLDAPQLTAVLDRHGGVEQVRAVVMHELGHVVGLAHVDDRHELMYEHNTGRTEFGPGDLRGLAKVGHGRCFGAP